MAKAADAFRTISETAEIVGVPSHVLRFWEGKFPQVKPTKRAGNRRYYRPDDIALLCGIRQLLHDDGLTIRGVQKIIKEQGVRHVSELGRALMGEQEQPAPEPLELPAPPEVADIADDIPQEPAAAPEEEAAPHSFLPEFEPTADQIIESAPEEEPEAASFDAVWAQTPLFEDEEEAFDPLIEEEAQEAPQDAAPDAAEDDSPEAVESALPVEPAPPRPSPEQSAAALASVTLPDPAPAAAEALPPTRISILVARISTISPEAMSRTEQIALGRAADRLHALRRDLSREIRP